MRDGEVVERARRRSGERGIMGGERDVLKTLKIHMPWYCYFTDSYKRKPDYITTGEYY